MAGVNDGLAGEGEQEVPDAAQDGGFVAVGEPGAGGPRPALEQRVAGDQPAGRRVVEAARPGRVAGRVDHPQPVAGRLQDGAVLQVPVPVGVGPVDPVPQHPIRRMEQDRGVHRLPQGRSPVYMVAVAVGQHDGLHPPARRRRHDGLMVVGSVEHQHLPVVAQQPDVVGHLQLEAVQAEETVGRYQFQRHDFTCFLEKSPNPEEAELTSRPRSGAPRPVPSCGRLPPHPRSRSPRTRSGPGRGGPAGTGRSASGSPWTAGSRRTSSI